MESSSLRYSDRLIKDMIGKQFGRWTVLADAGVSTECHRLLLCRCDCGNERKIRGTSLRSGGSQSCGCTKTHGCSRTREYRTWNHMKARCTNPKSDNFRNYGGRRITVCQRWMDSFEAFLSDVGPAPTRHHTLDRFPDKNGSYEPGNVRWATQVEQANNTRANITYVIEGVEKTLSDWVADSGLKYTTVWQRLRNGWAIKDALRLSPLYNPPRRGSGIKLGRRQ